MASVVAETNTLNEPVLPRVAAGDASAVQDCLDRYGALVWSLAKRLSASPSEVEDAVQEVFIELWRLAKEYDIRLGSETTFIAMITRRRLIDRRRRGKTMVAFPSLDDQASEPMADPTPDRVELWDEVVKARACFDKLSRSSQDVLQLSIHEGISYSQIALQLRIPLGSVKSFARRGLLALRDCMSRPYSKLSGEASS